MKIILAKDWEYDSYSGKVILKKGYVFYNNKRAKKAPEPVYNYENGLCKDGWILQNWIAYGDNSLVPMEYLKIEK